MKYALMFPNGEYVGIDRASGGYPYPVNWHGNVCFWESEEKAKKYSSMFPEKRMRICKILGFQIENG